ncbi:MAG: hypothetical protein ACR2G7_01955 [Acidimicrobiales bacterium]
MSRPSQDVAASAATAGHLPTAAPSDRALAMIVATLAMPRLSTAGHLATAGRSAAAGTDGAGAGSGRFAPLAFVGARPQAHQLAQGVGGVGLGGLGPPGQAGGVEDLAS